MLLLLLLLLLVVVLGGGGVRLRGNGGDDDDTAMEDTFFNGTFSTGAHSIPFTIMQGSVMMVLASSDGSAAELLLSRLFQGDRLLMVAFFIVVRGVVGSPSLVQQKQQPQ